ncbi:F420-non-reducing hydrogenase iron-sulfur subunit D (fragment) [Desulforamulus hydrothermalis Lam5 = DSM 18033]
MGIEKDRVNFTWVSASEGARFAELITELTGRVKAMGPNKGLFQKAE